MCVLLTVMQYRVITAYIYIHTHTHGINTGKWCNSSATTPLNFNSYGACTVYVYTVTYMYMYMDEGASVCFSN